VTHERTPVGKEFHARAPATQKPLSLVRRLVRGMNYTVERKRVLDYSSVRPTLIDWLKQVA